MNLTSLNRSQHPSLHYNHPPTVYKEVCEISGNYSAKDFQLKEAAEPVEHLKNSERLDPSGFKKRNRNSLLTSTGKFFNGLLLRVKDVICFRFTRY